MKLTFVALSAAGILLLLLCVQPALGSPDAVSYEQYVTLVHDQAHEGGCIGYSYLHVLEILKEVEAPYTPDPSYAYLNYVFWMATTPDTGIFVDPRFPHDPGLGGIPLLKTYGLPPETSYPTNFDVLGMYPLWLAHPPSPTAYNEAFDYRIADSGWTITNYTPSIADAEECIATYGPLACHQLYPAHTVALIGYDRTRQEFTIVDSANWQGIGHAGIKKVPYADFAARQPNMTLEVLKNRPTPMTHPYTARIRISHEYRRSMLTVKIGAVGHEPVTVWDRNNRNNYADLGTDLNIDVPLPSYAAEHWPPSDQNQWYVRVTNEDSGQTNAKNAVLKEVTLVKRSANDTTPATYPQLGLPRTIPPGTAEIVFPNAVTVTGQDGGQWTGGARRTITWTQRGLTGTNLKIELRQGYGLAATIAPSVPASAGTWDWQVPTDFVPGLDYYVRIESLVDPRVNDTSDGLITVRSPVADFTADPVSGSTPLAVQFTDTSTGQPTSWSWDFGNGQTSTAQSPRPAYDTAGTYSVSLTVTYADGGSRSVTKTNLVWVYGALDPGFTVGSRVGYAPYAAAFTDETTGGPTTWHWDFGDGQSSSVRNPVHTYQSPGTYTVQLAVSNPVAGTKTATKTDYIRVLPLWNGLIRTEAEDYDYDHPTEGVGYHDTTPGNSGGVYRTEDVDIVAIGSGMKLGYAVNDTAEGEWTRYWVTSPAAENYTYPLSLSLAGWGGRVRQTITVTVAGMPGATEITVPNTGSPTSYAFSNATLALKPGTNTIYFIYHGNAMNFDFFTLDPSGIPPAPGRILTVPGAIGLPTSISVVGKYDDVNGNGRKDFADVVLYFNQMAWIVANEPVTAFDYNANDRIDFADVVWLFNHL